MGHNIQIKEYLTVQCWQQSPKASYLSEKLKKIGETEIRLIRRGKLINMDLFM